MGYPFRSRLEHDPLGTVAVIQMKDIDDTNVLQGQQPIRVALPTGKAHHLLREGDLLFRSRGKSNGAALVHQRVGTAVLAAPLLLIRPHRILPEYLCWYLNSPTTQVQLAALSEGTSVRMISAETLKALDVPLPSRPAQQAIAHAATMAERERVLVTRVSTLRQQLTTHLLMTFAQRTAE